MCWSASDVRVLVCRGAAKGPRAGGAQACWRNRIRTVRIDGASTPSHPRALPRWNCDCCTEPRPRVPRPVFGRRRGRRCSQVPRPAATQKSNATVQGPLVDFHPVTVWLQMDDDELTLVTAKRREHQAVIKSKLSETRWLSNASHVCAGSALSPACRGGPWWPWLMNLLMTSRGIFGLRP